MPRSGDRPCSCRCSAQWLFSRWTLIFSTWCIPVLLLVFGSPSEEAVDWHEPAMEGVDKERNSCKRPRAALAGGSASAAATAAAWRSCRVARAAAGGKDRHSKVVTARGLRDRRVRLSVPTAIQFYDIQDRLGVDQPSKAIEWLIRAAATAIDALPSLDCSFILPSSAAADDTDNADDAEASTSETSKSSVLSLANAPDNANATAHKANAYSANASAGIGTQSQAQGTFAELLNCSTTDKPMQQHTLAYYATQSSHIAPMSIEMMPQLAFSQEPHLPAAFDRGTLQSNAATAALWPPSHNQYLMHRFAAPADAPSLPFIFGGSGAAAPATANTERRLQLWDFKGEGKS